MLDVVEELFQQGVELHKSGKVEVASQLYTAVLKAQPEHPTANHNMGILAVGGGKVQEALPYFEAALEANADTAQFWLSYIAALIEVERMADAQAVFDQAKSNGAKGDGFDQLERRLNVLNEELLETSITASEAHQDQPNILETLKLDQALRLAKKTAKEGSLGDAKRIYQDVLLKFPKNKRAIDGIKALAGVPVGKASEVQDPPQGQKHSLINLYSQGQLEQALEQANVLLQQFPNSSFLYNICGAVYKGLGQLDASIEAYNKALVLKPDYAEAYNNMGAALRVHGKLEEAIEAYTKALAIRPDFAEAYYNMGFALQEQGKLEETIEAYTKALALRPDYAEAYNNMGVGLQDQGKLEEAIEAFNKALVFKPDYADAYYNTGVTLKEQGKLEEAIEAFNKALALKPDYAEAYNNMGATLQELGKLEEAIEACNKAIAIKPDLAQAHHNLSFALLKNGRLSEGLDEYEWRWKTSKFLGRKRLFSQPLWDGKTSLKGKRILVWSEQGVGDTINWSSCLSLVSAQARHCILECQEKLVPLLARSFPDVEVRPENRNSDSERDDFDFHLPMGSLYRLLIPKLSQNSKANAFLVPEPARVSFWRERLTSLGNGPFIGISWKSSDMSLSRLPNYAPVSEWSSILTIPGVTFINLQYTDAVDDLAKIQNEFGVTVHNFDDLDHYNNLADVAALSAALDVVVSVQSAVPTISAGVGTCTKLALWRQSSWNNILNSPSGPLVDKFVRNTWEPWSSVFSLIAEDIASHHGL